MHKLALAISLIASAAGATDLYVDNSATTAGDCISAPCLRITDALNVARQMGGNVDIHVASGTYNGTTDPAKLAENPALEAMPLLLNVPGIHLHGASKLIFDAEVLPSHVGKGPATRINSDSLTAFGAMIQVTPTVDAATGTPTSGPLTDISIDGFEFDGTHGAFDKAVQFDRVSGFSMSGNYLHNFSTGVAVYRSSGTFDRNLVVDPKGGPDIIVFGGTATSPSNIVISNNRLVDAAAGIIVSGMADQELPMLFDLGANTAFAPAPADSSPANVINATLLHNDCSNNGIGARLEARAAFPDPAVPSAKVHVTLTGNHFDANQFYGISIEEGTTLGSQYHFDFTGVFSTFCANSFVGNGHAPLLLSFSSVGFAPSGGGGPYATNSTITATGVGSIAPGLGGIEYDAPASWNTITLGNTITLDGATLAPGTVVTLGR